MNKNNSDYIYYDLQFNNVSGDLNNLPNLQFVDNRSSPIISKANDYKMSIVRFQVDTSYLPSYVCLVQPNQSNPNLSIYSVTLKFGSNESSQNFLIWIPVNKNLTIPSNSNQIQDFNNQYYWGYNSQYFLDLLNTQLKIALDELIVLDNSLTGCEYPFFRWENNKVVLYTDSTFDIQVFFNKGLYSKFSSFNLIYYKENTNGKNYEIIVDKFYKVQIDGDYYYRTEQEYDIVSNWSPVSSILFLGNGLPVQYSLASPSINQIEGYNVNVNSSDYNNIITDIQVNEQWYKSNIIYNPSAEYRWISLLGTDGIKDVNISVFWKDKVGNIHSLKMNPGCSATMKILFQKI